MIRFSRLLLVMFGIPTAYFIYTLFSDNKSEYSYLIIPLGIIIAIVLVLQHQIDSWLIKKTEQKLDPALVSILEKKILNYNSLFSGSYYTNTDHAVFTHACDFIGQGLESIPLDLKHIITAHAFYFGNENHPKWPKHYNRIVLYKHPFLSPQYEDQVHSVESYEKDGVFIFSLEQLIPGINNGGSSYNIALHGFAEGFLRLYPVRSVLSEDEIWSRLSNHLGIIKEQITALVGLDDFSALIPVAQYYIYNRKKVTSIFPELKDNLFLVINAEKNLEHR